MQIGPRFQGPAIRASGALKWVFILFCVLIDSIAGEFVLPLAPATTARIGQAFDAKKGKFLYKNLYSAPQGWDRAITRESKYFFDYEYKSIEKASDVFLNLDLSVEIKVGFQAGPGYLSIAAKGAFAMLKRDFSKRAYKMFTMKFISVVDTINAQSAIGPDTNLLNAAIDVGATHYVKNLIYGGEFIAEVSYEKNDKMDTFLLDLSLAAKYSLPAFPGGIAAAGGFTLNREEMETAEKTEIRVYAAPGQIEAPISLLQLMTYLANYKQFLASDPTGQVISCTLGDLKDFQVVGMKDVVYHLPNNYQVDAVSNQLNDLIMTRSLLQINAKKIDYYQHNFNNEYVEFFMEQISGSTEEARSALLEDLAGVTNFDRPEMNLLTGMRAYGTRRTHKNDKPIYPCASGVDRFTYEIDNILADIDRCMDANYCNGHGICRIINKKDPEICLSSNSICECEPGWYGDRCSWHACQGVVNKFRTGPCMNSPQRCDIKSAEPGYVCTCSQPFYGSRCMEGICQKNEVERGEPLCKNNASCINTNFYPYFRCNCEDSPGFLGLTCEVHYCDALEACGNRGICARTTGDNIGYRCECQNGYSGDMCQYDLCMTTNPCNEQSLCVMDSSRDNGYRCDCNVDYTGPNCDQHKVCDLDVDVCKNGGRCIPEIFEPFYKCDCDLPWYGPRCDTDICTFWDHSPDHVDPCGASTMNCVPQFNTIIDQVTGQERPLQLTDIPTTRAAPSVDELRGEDKAFTCDCNGGWTGKDCDINICDDKESDVCFGGVCMPRIDYQEYPLGYKCECTPGFKSAPGQNDCAISTVCTSMNNPCMNGSTCVPRPDLALGFSCSNCDVGFYGEYCTKHVCQRVNDPICKNGGRCIASTDNARGFICECQAGLGGITCENDTL